ncbi:hypothetical protein ACHAPT_004867 [Fusarium lateritium]
MSQDDYFYGRQRHRGPVKGDGETDDYDADFPIVRYQGTRIDDDDDGNLPPRPNLGRAYDRQRLSNRSNGHGVPAHYDDRDTLHLHGIRYLSPYKAANQVPRTVISIFEQVMRQDGEIPGVTAGRIREDALLHTLEESGSLALIKEYFGPIFSPPPSGSRVQCAEDQAICHGIVPHRENLAGPRPPTPTMLYGYSFDVFSDVEKQQAALLEAEATMSCLLYPFFTIDIRCDGPTSTGSLWEATNTCLASSAACVSLFSKLERRVRQTSRPFAPELSNVAFSVAMSGTEARLFVTCTVDEGMYGMFKAKSFLLQDPDHHIKFRKCVRNILEWGQHRLGKIREALRFLRTNEGNLAMRSTFLDGEI